MTCRGAGLHIGLSKSLNKKRQAQAALVVRAKGSKSNESKIVSKTNL
jgi:hypothetical protein